MNAWEKFVEAQEAELGSETVQKWLKPLNVIRFDACNLYLEASDAFQAMWFEEHLRQKVQTSLYNNNRKRIKVHLSIANVAPKSKNRSSKAKETGEIVKPAFALAFDNLDPHCTFANFVPIEANQLVSCIFNQIAGVTSNAQDEAIVSTLNPLYIHGGCGSGKTHILMATAHALRQRGLNVIYSGANCFTDHVVSAIRAGEMSAFRQIYRKSDVLIIDDVHAFSRRGTTQEEFFHTFNALHIAGKQIILSANCPPGELQFVEPRLVSRFEWGIVLSLENPSREEAAKILTAKLEAHHFLLHPKVMEFLLDSFGSTKSLNKAVEALILRSHMNQTSGKTHHSQLTVAMVTQILADLLTEEQQVALTPQRIVQGVAEYFGIKPEDVLGKAQTRDCVLPRQISMHLCRHQLKLPYKKIGDLFAKDHSTVMSSVKLIQKSVDADDAEIASAHRSIVKKIKTSSMQEG